METSLDILHCAQASCNGNIEIDKTYKIYCYWKTYFHVFTWTLKYMCISNLTGNCLKSVKQSVGSDLILECNFHVLASDANKFRLLINSFYATGIFLSPLKTSENLWFYGVFRGYTKFHRAQEYCYGNIQMQSFTDVL